MTLLMTVVVAIVCAVIGGVIGAMVALSLGQGVLRSRHAAQMTELRELGHVRSRHQTDHD